MSAQRTRTSESHSRIVTVGIDRSATQSHRIITHCCTACEGLGVGEDRDWDEFGEIRIRVVCEYCDASGMTTSCRHCGDVISVPAAERTNGYCEQCEH